MCACVRELEIAGNCEQKSCLRAPSHDHATISDDCLRLVSHDTIVALTRQKSCLIESG